MEVFLDANYRTEGEEPVIELFYRPEGEGDKKLKEVRNFRPYFYAVPVGSADALLEEIKGEEFHNISSLDIVKRVDLRDEIEVVRISVRHPRDVAELRNRVRDLGECKETREDDIRFTQRYIIDAGIVPMEGADNKTLRIASFDIETIQEGDKNIPIMISYKDNKGMRRVWNYKYKPKLDFVEKVEDEAAMIRAFIETVKKQGIDIIVTYNGDNFDFEVLKERCGELGVPFSLGARDYEVKMERRGMNMGARVIGRPHVDLYPVCRRMFNLPRYTLEDVHLALFDEEKLDIDVEKIGEWWEKGENLEELFSYSMADAESGLRIAMEVLPTEYELSQLIGQPLFEASRMGSGNAIEWLLMRIAHKKGILVPPKPSDREYASRRMDTYEGAYVVDPVRGIHDNILVFDFRSLYPSIIISHNIDPSTINCECCKTDGHVSPNGIRFCKRRRGLIPELLDNILKSRIKVKLELKRLKESGGSATKIKSLDARQKALKILANSAYGYMGFSRARWYNNDCASAVAAWGREYIKNTIKAAEEEGFKVVYGDTDSLMLAIPGDITEEEVKRVKREFLEKINKRLPPAMELEFEGFYTRGVFVTKKRYALIDPEKRLTVKGLETKRRDWAPIAKKTQEKVLHTILWEKNPKKAAEIVKSVIRELRERRTPLKDLVIYTQITKPLGEYENVGPHVQAARKAQKRGKRIVPGDVIQYIITTKGNSISDKAEMVGFVKENDYDAEYYINNQVLPAVMRILEALGYGEDELKGMGRQTTLSGF